MSRRDPEPLLSVFEHDPEMADLVVAFVAEIPSRRADLEAAVDAGDLEAAIVLAHQLKGAAGGYGFEELGLFAAESERALVALRGAPVRVDALRLASAPLMDACGRVRLALTPSAA